LWQDEKPDIIRVDIILRSAVRAPMPASTVEKSASQQGIAPKGSTAPKAIGAFTSPSFSVGENTQGFSGSPLDPRYTFASFVEGPSNRMAHAAARSVAEAGPGALSFNPLFIHASVGLGKTHLLQSIAWSVRRTAGGAKVLYLTAEYFMWRFATAIRDQSALSFKESLRDIDLLLIDDMQFLQGKSIQQEFCHLLNALIDSAKQVVVAADRPPAELESLDLRVRSRLQGGVALEIASPDLQMRRSMLEVRYQQSLNEGLDLEIAPEILDFVARTVTTSGRDVEGAYNQLMVQHRFSEGPLNIENIEILLKHLVKSGEQKRVRIEDIQKVVSRHYNVSKNDLLSNRRTRVIVRPRQIAMYLAKALTPRSLPEIGRRFGGRDHTTVLHAVRKVEKMFSDDVKLSHEIELLKRLIME
jgi:chromosomal replication initiator protein